MKVLATKIYFCISYDTLDEWIKEYYDVEDFECSWESPNDTEYAWDNIEKQEQLDQWNVTYIKAALANKGCTIREARTFIEDLVSKEVLPEGNYLLSVCW